MSLILAQQSKTRIVEFGLKDQEGNAITATLAGADKVRGVIGRLGESAKLTVTSGSNTSNGSSFTKDTDISGSGEAGTHTLRLDALDLDFDPGTYSLSIEWQDASEDASAWLTSERHVFVLQDS